MRSVSRLDAFSAYLSIRSYSAMQLAAQQIHQRYVQLGPLVLKSDPLKFLTPTTDRDRTVSRRSEPSSRATLMGEQPNPWDLLQPQDVTSRHRGAKPPRRYELLGEISLLSPEYLLSFERWPFHTEPPDHYVRLSTLIDLSGLTVKHPYAITLYARLPSVLRIPLKASDTFLEATTPVKLPTTHCPPHRGVRFKYIKGGISPTTPQDLASSFKVSHLSYTLYIQNQCEAIVKVHGVFSSRCG